MPRLTRPNRSGTMRGGRRGTDPLEATAAGRDANVGRRLVPAASAPATAPVNDLIANRRASHPAVGEDLAHQAHPDLPVRSKGTARGVQCAPVAGCEQELDQGLGRDPQAADGVASRIGAATEHPPIETSGRYRQSRSTTRSVDQAIRARPSAVQAARLRRGGSRAAMVTAPTGRPHRGDESAQPLRMTR